MNPIQRALNNAYRVQAANRQIEKGDFSGGLFNDRRAGAGVPVDKPSLPAAKKEVKAIVKKSPTKRQTAKGK